MGQRGVVAATVLLGLAASACSQEAECEVFLASSPVILVVDAETGMPICDATIVVTSQSYGEGSGPATETPASGSEPVDDAGSGGDASGDFTVGPSSVNDAGVCVYGGVNADVATLRVSRQGYRAEDVGNVYVTTSGNCNATVPAPQMVTVRLTPE